MSIQDAYNQWSDAYDHDENRTRDLDQQVTRAVLEGQTFSSILELGCGTGKNTLFLAQMGKHVRALDFSAGMLAQARAKVSASHVEFTQTDLTQRWPVSNEAVELVVCNLVLEHIENLEFIFAEVARVLKLEGQFLLNELHPFRQYAGRKARFQRGTETVKVEAYVHHISDFLGAARLAHLSLGWLHEHWHTADSHKPPRLVSFLFEKDT